MTKILSEKSRVAMMSLMRRTAMMGAAATAVFAIAPSSYAGVRVGRSTTVQTAVKDILSVPPNAGEPEAIAALLANTISIENTEDITVGADATALGQTSVEDHVSLTNSGDLTGGIGIDVSTGENDLADVLRVETRSFNFALNAAPIWDDYGNPILDAYGNQQTVATSVFNYSHNTDVLRPDPRDSAISIDNSGSIAFSGRHGVKAANPAGQSITIANSGDITSTQDTAFRSGIDVSAKERFSGTYTPAVQTATGSFTYNGYGQLTGVVAPDEFTASYDITAMDYDAGAISIHNSGNIDMGVVAAPPGFGGPSGFASIGIHTEGDGGTTIVNSGDIKVGKWSAGIYASSTAATSISNSGRIDIGNASSGISFAPSSGSAGDYRLGGDVYVLNTGDILGGVTKAEVEPGERVEVTGISVTSLGSNNEFFAAQAQYNELFAYYNDLLGSEVYPLFDIPKTRLYTTTTVNRGHIELKDGGAGIFVTPMAGDSTAINEGTIIVGDGASNAVANSPNRSGGVYQNNFQVEGRGLTTTMNTETGIIVTGDDSVGIANMNIGGTSIAINEGSITTGDGVSTLVTPYSGESYDRLFASRGILSVNAGGGMGRSAYARNSGDLTVGDLAAGMYVSGQGYSPLNLSAPSALSVNDGIIETGDNSSGVFTMGTNALTYNTGSVTTGNYDISAFKPHPEYTADEFAKLRYGVTSWGAVLSYVVNHGTVTTGDNTVGAAARMYSPGYGSTARLIQNEDGVITTGDDSIGARIAGNYYAALDNQGGISVGNDSVGVDMSAGSVTLRYGELTATVIEGALVASNTGIIETGDNSVGVRMTGVHENVAYSRNVYVPDPNNPPYYHAVEISGAADSFGASYLVNAGTIRVGANSTAVEMTGEAINEQGLHLFNTGTIQAGQGSTAISVNANNSIGSYVVNVGTIAGDVVFGDGDDKLMNTQFQDNVGKLVSTGNIVMNGSTIDFGGGANRFDNDRGLITIAGGDNLITGADLFMTQASIEARNNAAGSRLTIDGNLSGSFTFGADISNGGTDQLVITGNVADDSTMSVVLNPTEQLSGEKSFTVITVDGENSADDPVITGVTGQFADSLQDAQASFSEATGEVTVTTRFGMGHMATAAASATTMAQNWWMQSLGSFDKRDMQKLAGAKDSGPSVWAVAMHDEGTVTPANSLQDASFDQQLSGLQTGITWALDVAGGSFSFSPMFSYGSANAALNANLSSAKGDASALGVNANYAFKNGLYVNATWQKMAMDVDFKTPGTFSNAVGETDAEGDGFNVEMGYAYQLKSGLTLAPQLQYASVDVDLEDFASSDGVYSLSGLGGKSSLLRAGLSVFKTFETKNGFITPLADLSYLDMADGDSTLQSNGVSFANDTSGSGYRAEFGIAGRYKAWDITGRVGMTDTAASSQSLSTNVTVRYRW